MPRQPLYAILAVAVLMLAIVPVGTAVFVLGFIHGDSPCVMCWAQRIGMALIALTGLFILRYGPKPRYVGLAVLIGAWGLHMGVRHTALHAARDIGQGFSLEILGAHTYTWSVFIFWICVVTMGLLLMWLKEGPAGGARREFGALESVTASVLLLVIAANAVQAFASTGPPPYMGQSDPVRFSFNPAHWVWSLEEWDPKIPVSWRGRWAVPKPSLDGVTADPTAGPLTGVAPVEVARLRQLALPLDGPITDLAYDAGTDRFALTTARGVYLTDGALARVLRATIVDTLYAVDLSTFAGAAFLDAKTLMAVGQNKSYVVLREAEQGQAARNFRYFLASADQFDESGRGRLTTVRARLMYILSAAYDPASDSLLTVSVPNRSNRRLVVSRFDRKDMTLSQEFVPTLAAGSGLALAEGRAIAEYVVTGAAVADGVLYALSAAHSTILAIDLASRQVTAAWAVPGLERPAGLAIKGQQFFIVDDAGTLTVVNR